jgi:hypothetical protein
MVHDGSPLCRHPNLDEQLAATCRRLRLWIHALKRAFGNAPLNQYLGCFSSTFQIIPLYIEWCLIALTTLPQSLT